ncbi:MAG: polyprenyl synthetase family protein [Saprospiraceae bacterium]|nr:polyprenyl synthetase family protein [Saprospiraceae bacterium]
MTNLISLQELTHIYNSYSEQQDWKLEPASLYEPFDYIMGQKGKKIRPLSLLLVYSLFNENYQKALPAAYAIDMFHNFTLIHDDLMDQSSVRRGQPTVPLRFGENVAILSGDAMLLESLKLIMTSSGYNQEVISFFIKTAIEVCQGQSLDMGFEKKESISLKEYLEMIRLKTSVLLGACFKIATQLAQQNLDLQDKMYELGCNLGIAFQIQDDYLDLYSSEMSFGKKKGGDLIQRKKSILLLLAIESFSKDEKKQFIKEYHQKRSDEQQVMKYLKIFEALNIKQRTTELFTYYQNSINCTLNEIELPSDKKLLLSEFVSLILQRNH